MRLWNEILRHWWIEYNLEVILMEILMGYVLDFVALRSLLCSLDKLSNK